MNSIRRDLTCAALLLAVAVGYYALARGIEQTALSDGVGPAGLPRIYAAALALIAVALATVAWFRRSVADSETARPDGVAPLRRLARGAGSVAIGIVYLTLVPVVGYLFAIALTIAAMAMYQGERPSVRVVLIAAAGAVAMFLLFDRLLGVPMPAPWSS